MTPSGKIGSEGSDDSGLVGPDAPGVDYQVFEFTNLLIPAGTDWTHAVNEDQLLTIDPVVAAGTYTLTFDGQTTAAIAFDATFDTVQAALEALSSIGTGNIRVEGGLPEYHLVFIGALGSANQPTTVFNGAGLDDAGASGISVQNEGKPETGHLVGEFTVDGLSGYINHVAFYLDPDTPDPLGYVRLEMVIPEQDPVIFIGTDSSASNNSTYGFKENYGAIIEDLDTLQIDTPEDSYTMQVYVIASAPPTDITIVRARASFLVI